MDRQKLSEYYDIFLEDIQKSADEKVRVAYRAYNRVLDDYISAIQEDLFYQAFQYGYEQGLKAAKKTA